MSCLGNVGSGVKVSGLAFCGFGRREPDLIHRKTSKPKKPYPKGPCTQIVYTLALK